MFTVIGFFVRERWIYNITLENINFRQEIFRPITLSLVRPTYTGFRLKRAIHHSGIPALLRPVIYRSAKRAMCAPLRSFELLLPCRRIGIHHSFPEMHLRGKTRAPAKRTAFDESFFFFQYIHVPLPSYKHTRFRYIKNEHYLIFLIYSEVLSHLFIYLKKICIQLNVYRDICEFSILFHALRFIFISIEKKT